MSLNAGAGGNVGTIVQAGFALADALNRGKGWNKRDRRNLDAAVAAGYSVQSGRRGVPVVRDPVGNRITTADLLVAGKRIRTAPAPAPAPTPAPQLPTGGDILEDLLRRPSGRIGTGELPRTGQQGRDLLDDILRRNPDVRPPEPATRSPVERPKWVRVAGRAARVLGRVGGVIGGVLYPSETSPDDVLYPPGTAMPAPQPDRPRGPPRRPVRTRQPRDLPKLPEPWPGSIPDRSGPQREPSPGSPAPLPTVLLPLPDVLRGPKRQPRPNVRPTTASPAGPLPTTLPNPLVVPFRSPSVVLNPLVPPSGPNRRIRETEARAPLTMPQPLPIGSAYREPPSDRCSCPPKRKRKPSEPRKVCYTGAYREKSRGLIKTPRRKVPCL